MRQMDIEGDNPMESLIRQSVTYRIATGPSSPPPGAADIEACDIDNQLNLFNNLTGQ